MEQQREISSTLVVVAIEKGVFWSSSTTVANFTMLLLIYLSLPLNSLGIKIYISDHGMANIKF